LALTGLILATGADASAQVVVGGGGASVTVDLGVLDSLGPAPTLPALLKGRSSQRISLRPPVPTSQARPAAARPAPTRDEPSKPAAPAPTMAAVPAPAAAAPTPIAPPPPPAPAAAAPPAPAPVQAAAPPPPAPAAPPPPPRVAAAPAPAPAPPPPTQTAARPPAALPPAAIGGAGPRLVFGAGSAELPAGADATLKDMAQRMNADESLRLQVVAYAEGTADQASQARRLSLSRALTVRSYLISQGVRSTRIDVRALGARASDGPADRVDLLIGDR